MNESKRGGKRKGAGRKTGTGAFKEPTIVKRVPKSVVPLLDHFLEQLKQLSPCAELPEKSLLLNNTLKKQFSPLATDPVRAGFLERAESTIENYIDFNEYLSEDNQHIIGIYAEGNSMSDAGIDDGDLLVVNRNSNPRDRDIVVAQFNEGFTVKRLRLNSQGISLHPENQYESYPVIQPSENDTIHLVGSVSFVIKKIR